MATSRSSSTEPSGYVLEPLRKGSDFTLYRGLQRGNSTPVLAVAPSEQQPSPRSLSRLEHEFSLTSELDPAWAVKPLALTRYEKRTVLILEDPGGEPLDLILERNRGRPLGLARSLSVAIGLAKALGQVHRQGLIHKDIKSANVLVDDAGNVWLTGFGLASRLLHERLAPTPPEIIAGTLAYMAPEQTGRMNRSMDTRSDLYSLGVTFYQMLTGTLPFAAADPLEWVHCHIARQPTPPDERAEVPEPLSAIAMRLLAKNAEERYQTAFGLEADLRQCLARWESNGRIDPFPLGTHDVPERLLIPEKLYGREREVGVLLAAFNRVVAHGTPELVLVSGYSGIGKSSVVNELHKALVSPRGHFAAGKFDQYKRDIPYATLAQAFQTLIRQILVKSEADVKQWRCALAEAVGPNGQLIATFIPELELIIGKQPPIPDLPPRDAQNRFQLVFRRFLGAFARPEHPLALFLDDLQWLDAASLGLLEYLVKHSETKHLLLVGAYRDNEVGPAHLLMRTVDEIRSVGARVEEIVLAPLGRDDVGQLVADALRCEPERARPLAELVQEKTGGNPFFAIQFFTTLADEGLLAFDSHTRAWRWDIYRIRAKSYTENVVDLMSGKLKRLSATTQEVLKAFACLGNVAEVATLAMVHRETEEAMHAALSEAVRGGLVFPEEKSYKFLHDRIQEAAYSLIPDNHRADIHLSIGRALRASMTADQLAEHLFDVANQFNRGSLLLVDRNEKTDVARINLYAGRKAKASTAYASARGYFRAAMALLDEEDWGRQYELTFSLWLECAQCELLSGHFEESEQLMVELLRRGASKLDQAAVYHLKIQLHAVKGEYRQAVDNALTCLRLFGIDLPSHPTWEQVQAEYEAVWQTLNGRPIESLINLPLIKDPEQQAAMQVFVYLTPAAYLTDFHLCCVQFCRAVKISIESGTSAASAHAYSYLGTILGPVFHRYADAFRLAKLGGDLVEKHGFFAQRAHVHYAMGRVAFWTQPITTAIDLMRATSRSVMETGDLTLACFCMVQTVTGLLLRNDPLDAVDRESERAMDFAQQAKYDDAAEVIRNQRRFIAAMQGRTASLSTFSDQQFDEITFAARLPGDQRPMTICWYWILKLKARFLSGEYAEALVAADKGKPLLSAVAAQIQLLDYFYYAALSVAACYENASADEQQGQRKLLVTHQEQLREWAENYPPTFADKHALVSAEVARLEGRTLDAMHFYEQAIQSARENGFVQNEALAHEVAARFYLAAGLETIAYTYLRNARYCYERWKAPGKVKQLDELYPRLHQDPLPASTTAAIGGPVCELDLETVVKATQALSSEIVLNKLIEKLMRIAVENAGAERGLLILLRRDEPLIEAEAVSGHTGVEINVRRTIPSPLDLPMSALQYAIRTGERVILDDALVRNLYSEDLYVRQRRPRSVFCLPIVKQSKLIGALYLENNLTPSVFTSDRVSVLELLASQAAISLENANLYAGLKRSEAYLAQGQAISRTGSFGRNVITGEIYWSEETYKIFEHDRSVEPTLESVLERIHPEDRDLALQKIEYATHQRIGFDIEYRMLRPDSSVKYLHVVARASGPSTGDLEFVGTVSDVTERKQAEEALRRSEAYLAEAQRLAHMSSWAWRVPGMETVHISEEWYRIYGFDPSKDVPTWSELMERIHPEDRTKWKEAIDQAIEEKSDYEVEFRLLFPDGTIKYLQVFGHPVFGTSGDLIEFMGSSTDVTERTLAEEALRQAHTDLARANRVTTMGELAASLAHEVNQPISAAVTNAGACLQWLAGDQPNLEEARAAVTRIVRNGKRAGEIIDRIRAQFEKGNLKREAVDLNEIIREMIALLRGESMRHNISVRTELAADLPCVVGDRVQLQQVLMNLMINGFDAIKSVDGTRELAIRSQRAENDQVLVSVSDTGMGLPAQQADQIFNAFFTTKPHGTGMGLRISQSIIRSHGGRLWAGDNFPRGATFQFTLPVTIAAATA